MFEQFAGEARTVVTTAQDEARSRGDRRLGTEHFLLGLLSNENCRAAKALGISLGEARAGLDELDQGALTVIGIDIEGIDRSGVPAPARRMPFTSGARDILKRGLQEAKATRSRRIDTGHLLLAVLETRYPDPAAELIGHLGIDRTAVRERLQTI